MKLMKALNECLIGKTITPTNQDDSWKVWYDKENEDFKTDATDSNGNLELTKRDLELDWEIVDEDENWNLAEQRDKWGNEKLFSEISIKKCRDLILEDLNKFPKTFTVTGCYGAATESAYQVGFNKTKEIINKRFGDLE